MTFNKPWQQSLRWSWARLCAYRESGWPSKTVTSNSWDASAALCFVWSTLSPLMPNIPGTPQPLGYAACEVTQALLFNRYLCYIGVISSLTEASSCWNSSGQSRMCYPLCERHVVQAFVSSSYFRPHTSTERSMLFVHISLTCNYQRFSTNKDCPYFGATRWRSKTGKSRSKVSRMLALTSLHFVGF